ncbi:hypothetical protein Taro_034627, partial [Colocasia esculenta]|nr:hypothetical protein [Colocasia esculenta]
TTDDAYLHAYALKYGGKVYKSARRQVDVTGETASLQALLYSAMQDREVAQREAEQLVMEGARESEESSRGRSLLVQGSRELPVGSEGPTGSGGEESRGDVGGVGRAGDSAGDRH